MSTSTKSRFVVGVDFGTTFTSVAFAHSASPDEVKLVQTWPHCGSSHPTSDQVPTEIHYSDPTKRDCFWGYNIPRNPKSPVEPLKWFKLLLQNRLDSSDENERHISSSTLSSVLQNLNLFQKPLPPSMRASSTPADRTAKILKDIGLEPVTLIEDFLTGIRDCTLKSMEESYDVEWVRNSKIEYILTVPAIWKDSAKDIMVQAATRAKFGKHRTDFHLVSEPEAAAAYTLKAIQPNELNVNDTFVICDAGGGTVDLISYKIERLHPLKISESITGSGDLCGSVFLDHRFESYIREKIGERTINSMKPRSKIEMMSSWEQKVKFIFGNTPGIEGFEVNLQGVKDDPRKNIEDCFHIMQMEDVEAIFDPVVNRIIELVNEQAQNVEDKGGNVAAILLVGGFGSSAYLAHQLKNARLGALNRPISVLQPLNARTAIARGALLRGLDGSSVNERRARRYYGCIFNDYYQAGNGYDNYKTWCEARERWMVSDAIQWYIKRGTPIGPAVSEKARFVRYVPVYKESGGFIFYDTIYACDQEKSPDFIWKNRSAVYVVCTLISDLSTVKRSRFPQIKNSKGQEYYVVRFELEMSVIDEVLRFELLYEGQSYGLVSTKFE